MLRTTCIAGVMSGFVGGLLAICVLSGAGLTSILVHPAAAAAAGQQDVVSVRTLRLLDDGGRRRAELAMSPDGGPALFFYDTQGRNRLVLGLYSPAENEYPFVVLNDTSQRAAGIFRLFGGRETPVVVLKSTGRDRSIYGLHPDSSEAFLVNYSSVGRKTNVFGNY